MSGVPSRTTLRNARRRSTGLLSFRESFTPYLLGFCCAFVVMRTIDACGVPVGSLLGPDG